MNNSEKIANGVTEGEPELRRLFERTVPHAPEVDLEGLLSSRGGNGSSAGRSRRSLHGSPGAFTLAGLLACAAVVTAIVWLRPTNTFAQVQQRVAATKSVSYTARPIGERSNEDLRYAKNIITESKARRKTIEEKLKATSDESEQKKLETELSRLKKGLKLADDYLKKRGGNAPVDRFYVLGRYLQRQERSGIHGDLVDITDMKTGKHVRVSHKDRTVTIFTKQTVINRDGKQTESDIKQTPDLTVDFYSQIRNVPRTATKLAETKIIKERQHIGFRTSKKDGAYTWTRTYWVDDESKLPRQIDISARSDDKFYAPSDAVLEDIEFDVPLDESLFSTNTPAGYTAKESGLMSLE